MIDSAADYEDSAPRYTIQPQHSLSEIELRRKAAVRLGKAMASDMTIAEIISFLDGE